MTQTDLPPLAFDAPIEEQIPVHLHTDTAPEIHAGDIGQFPIGDESSPTTPRSLNRTIGRIAAEQGVAIGSWPWLLAGPMAWSGSSGEHGSYGWRHDHKVDQAYVHAAISNYGARPHHYDNAPFRSFNYEAAGRPKGTYKPTDPGDQPDGTKDYLVNGKIVTVTGIDAEHLWLEPLWAIIDVSDHEVPALGGTHPARDIAKILATLATRSAIGMIRDSSNGPKGQQPYSWGYGDRANSRILSTIIEAFKRGCLEVADVETATLWIRDVLLPFYERAPGISNFPTTWAPQGTFTIGTFNGLYWILPVAYEAYKTLSQSPVTEVLADRFLTLVQRWSNWALELESLIPGEGFNMSRFFVNERALRSGNGGKPLDSIAGLIEKKNIHFDPWRWDLQCYKAADVAAVVGGNQKLRSAADGILARHRHNQEKRAWLVNHAGEYADVEA